MARKKTRVLTLADLAARVAAIAPPELAEPWDNVGIQSGDPDRRVRRAMTCLEVTAPTLAEAKRRKADTLVSHHPLIFHPLQTVLESDPAQSLVAALLRARINLIVAHTNLDCARWGTNEALAEACGFRRVAPLDRRDAPAQLKLVVFTPEGYEAAIIDAVARGGGGRIGAYTHCTFRSPGTGTFFGGAGAKPFLGRAGRLEEAAELRIEAVVPLEARDAVLKEVLAAHPYDEPAYEFYVLAGGSGSTGLGCLAEPPRPISARALARAIKRRMNLSSVRLSGPPKRIVKKIAICTGSGGSLLEKAARAGADALLTGEATYHHGIEAHQRGLAMIEIGHFESEAVVAAPLARRLAEDPEIRESGAQLFAARDDLQPFVSL